MKKIKLNNLAIREMDKKEMRNIRGQGKPGNCCCACAYRDKEGSTVMANHTANNERGLYSPNALKKSRKLYRNSNNQQRLSN